MAPARRVPLAAGVAFNGNGAYRGFTVRETAAVVASFRIHEGLSATGTLLAAVSLPASGSVQFDTNVAFNGGLFVEVVAGTIEGGIFIA